MLKIDATLKSVPLLSYHAPLAFSFLSSFPLISYPFANRGAPSLGYNGLTIMLNPAIGVLRLAQSYLEL